MDFDFIERDAPSESEGKTLSYLEYVKHVAKVDTIQGNFKWMRKLTCSLLHFLMADFLDYAYHMSMEDKIQVTKVRL